MSHSSSLILVKYQVVNDFVLALGMGGGSLNELLDAFHRWERSTQWLPSSFSISCLQYSMDIRHQTQQMY